VKPNYKQSCLCGACCPTSRHMIVYLNTP
jgi:hypothetical protein